SSLTSISTPRISAVRALSTMATRIVSFVVGIGALESAIRAAAASRRLIGGRRYSSSAADDIEEQREDDAQQQRRRERKVEGEVPALDVDVARQPAQPRHTPDEHEHDAGQGDQEPEGHEDLADVASDHSKSPC